MKIYCSRQQKTDEELLQSLIGKDQWIRVCITFPYGGNMDCYIKINRMVPKPSDPSKVYYIYNTIMRSVLNKPSRWFDVNKACRTEYKCLVNEVSVVKPLDLYTTEEIRTIFDSVKGGT